MGGERLGIMGGTFDPIHIGHLVTAEAVRDEFGLDRVLFVPAALPPHKSGRRITPAGQRLHMVRLATASNPNFLVSTLEIERVGPSYTIDTIAALRKEYGTGTELYFITGADAMNELNTWHRIDELLAMCHFIAATRQGCELDTEKLQANFGAKGERRIHRLTTPALEISSTDIRARAKKGYSIKYIVPEPVEQYICKEGLYK